MDNHHITAGVIENTKSVFPRLIVVTPDVLWRIIQGGNYEE